MISPTLRETFRAALRHDGPQIALGLLIVIIGISSLLYFAFSKRSKARSPMYFGIFAALYGARLLLDNSVIPFALALAPRSVEYATSFITYIVGIPAQFLGYELFPEWRRPIRLVTIYMLGLAISGIVSDIIKRQPGSLHTINNVGVAVIAIVAALAIFTSRNPITGSVWLKWGVAIFESTVLLGNLHGLGYGLPFDPEPFGFAVFLLTLGRMMVVSILRGAEQLREITKELEIAARIQTSILPGEMPGLKGLEVAAQYLPMTAVAGDFYEFLPIDEHRLGVLIADVSGHGVGAALIASMVKIAIAAQRSHADDPGRVLAGMNQILCGKLQGQFVSTAYLYLDLKQGIFRYSAGGHPPLLWWSATERRVESLEENGLLLGIMPRAGYTSAERPLNKGDRFLLYTDGLIEGADANDDFFGETRVRQILSDRELISADSCAETLVAQLERHTGCDKGRSADDDLTVVVIDVR